MVAEVPVVEERFTSIMDSRGYLSDQDARILKAVKRQLKDLHIPGVTVKLDHETFRGGYQSADGLDTTRGPSERCFLVVRAPLKTRKEGRARPKKK